MEHNDQCTMNSHISLVYSNECYKMKYVWVRSVAAATVWIFHLWEISAMTSWSPRYIQYITRNLQLNNININKNIAAANDKQMTKVQLIVFYYFQVATPTGNSKVLQYTATMHISIIMLCAVQGEKINARCHNLLFYYHTQFIWVGVRVWVYTQVMQIYH